MSESETDTTTLAAMRADLERFLSGKLILPGLVSALDYGTMDLLECQPELVEELRRHWRIMDEICNAAASEAELVPLPRHRQPLEEALLAFGHVLERAIAEGRQGASAEQAD